MIEYIGFGMIVIAGVGILYHGYFDGIKKGYAKELAEVEAQVAEDIAAHYKKAFEDGVHEIIALEDEVKAVEARLANANAVVAQYEEEALNAGKLPF